MAQVITAAERGLGRLRATPQLQRRIAEQGRRLGWLAAKVGISMALMSHVVAGRRTVSGADARVIAALLDGDVGVLFDLPDGSEPDPIDNASEEAP